MRTVVDDFANWLFTVNYLVINYTLTGVRLNWCFAYKNLWQGNSAHCYTCTYSWFANSWLIVVDLRLCSPWVRIWVLVYLLSRTVITVGVLTLDVLRDASAGWRACVQARARVHGEFAWPWSTRALPFHYHFAAKTPHGYSRHRKVYPRRSRLVGTSTVWFYRVQLI